MSKKTESRVRAGIAGVVGAVVAFGISELVHGLYSSVPSILVSIAQRIVELTPGGLVTAGIELLGKADIPTLIATVLIGTVAITFFLGNLAVRHPPWRSPASPSSRPSPPQQPWRIRSWQRRRP